MHRDISPLLRHVTTPLSLHLPTNPWFYHSSADRHPPFNFGLPLFRTSPPTSNLYMVFNGRSTEPKTVTEQTKDKNKKNSITSGVHSTQSYLNSLSDDKPHRMKNGAEKSDSVQNTLLLPSRPSRDEDMDSPSSIISNITAAVTPEVQRNTDQVVTPKTTAQTPPELTPKVTEHAYNSVSLTIPNPHYDEGYPKLLNKGLESLSENSKNEVHASELKKPTTLVLKPVANVVAGPKGIAIAASISRAVVRKGQEVNIHFDPAAVAVVSPGGVADAHSELFLSYYEDLPSQKTEKR